MYPRLRTYILSMVAAMALAGTLAPPAEAEKPLILCIHPYLSASEIVRRFTPLAAHLSAKIGQPIAVEIGSTYDTHIHRIGSGVVDIAFMGPASYVQLTDQYGARSILAAFETREGKVFHGRIVTRQDSLITSLAQLKGKRFVFGDPNSTMSHMVPRYLLLKSGVGVKDLAEVKFVANHDNIALSLLAGTFDAGALKEEIFLQYQPQGLRALAKSPPIPDHLFIVRSGLPGKTTEALRDALLHLADSAEGRRILTGIRKDVVALAPADDKEYDILRAIVRELKQAGIEL